jgi:hypothetical protein
MPVLGPGARIPDKFSADYLDVHVNVKGAVIVLIKIIQPVTYAQRTAGGRSVQQQKPSV